MVKINKNILTHSKEIKDNSSIMGKVIKRGTKRFLKRREEKNLEDKYIAPPTDEWKALEGEFITYIAKRIDLTHFSMSLVTPRDKDTKGRVVLQLHGGGYEKGLLNYDTYFAKHYMREGILEVLTPNYRVAPENRFPAALEDAVSSYKWLLENNYKSENIIIAGDSAGGGLALATVMVLRKNKLPMPRAIITMSAWTDLECSLSSHKDRKNLDPVFGDLERPLIYRSRYAEGLDKKNPYISPLYGEYNDFPKMLMQVGTDEMLYHDTVEVAKKAIKAGVDVTLSQYDGMFHVFQAYKGVLKEANAAWDEVEKFILDIF